jgi:large subunit ribosomal protein L24
MAAPLSPELISSKSARALPVRKGDTVRVVRGDHAGFEGKVSRVDLKRYRIFLEGLTREKVDGTNIFVSVHPSKVIIKNLKLDDKWRKAVVERKKELELPEKEKKVVEVVEKPPKKAGKAKEEKAVKEEAAVQEKPAEKMPKAAKKKAPKKPVAEKKTEEKPAEKEKKPKTAKKKSPARRKAASKTEGGT